jgi:hypothetical protein
VTTAGRQLERRADLGSPFTCPRQFRKSYDSCLEVSVALRDAIRMPRNTPAATSATKTRLPMMSTAITATGEGIRGLSSVLSQGVMAKALSFDMATG